MEKLTPEGRIALKQKYPNQTLKTATVKKANGEKADFVFQFIDRTLMDLAGKQAAQSMTDAVTTQMLSTCVFGDKNLIQNDDFVFRGLLAKWQDIQAAAEVELGEL